MKIAVISDYSTACPPLAYGGSAYFFGVANELGKMGHEVHLFAIEGSKTPHNGYLHIIPKGERGAINPFLEIQMEEMYHDLLMSMDVIHDCSLSHWVSERLRHLYGKQEIVNTINGRVYHEPRPPFNVVTGSKAWQEDAKAHGLNSEMIHWGVDTTFYTPGIEKREDYYLWLARFHPDKGIDLALDLAQELGFKLKIAGSMEFADHEHYGKQYLQRIATMPNVEYVPLPMDETHHHAKRELYRKAKAFLYPINYFECFGLVVAEAMACGCPVITSDKGAMPELITDGSTGFVCKNKDEFKETITHFDDYDFDMYQADKYSVSEAAKKYEALYERVIAGYHW